MRTHPMPDRYIVIPRTMCFVFHDDEILLIDANSTKDWAGTWDPIGGHIEEGESILESARREIKEESGLDVRELRLAGVVHVSNFFGKNIMMFVTSSHTDTKEVVSDGREGVLHWVNIHETETVPVFPDVVPLLRRVLSDKKVFTARSRFENGTLVELAFD